MDLLPVLHKITKANTSVPHLKVIRIYDDTLTATDLVTTMQIKNAPFSNVDCTVDADTFVRGWELTKSPKLEQIGRTLRITDGNFKMDIHATDVNFPQVSLSSEKSFDPQAFLDAARYLNDYIKREKYATEASQMFVQDGFAYATDGMLCLRKSIGSDIGKLVVCKTFVEVLAGIKNNPVDGLVDKDSVTIIFEDAVVSSLKLDFDFPLDFGSLFAELTDNLIGSEISGDFVENLGKLCAYEKSADHILIFDSNGVTLDSPGKTLLRLNEKFDEEVRLHSSRLAKILKLKSLRLAFNWDPGKTIAFQSKDLDGLLSVAD